MTDKERIFLHMVHMGLTLFICHLVEIYDLTNKTAARLQNTSGFSTCTNTLRHDSYLVLRYENDKGYEMTS